MGRPVERWLLYALGGGLGHVGRAVALARAARRPGREFRLLTNSPFAHALPIERKLGGSATVARIAPDLGRDDVARAVRRELDAADFDALIVDTFPRGLGGELPPVLDRIRDRVPTVLVLRDLDPRYAARAEVRAAAARYARIILAGEPSPLGALPGAEATAPWLARDPGELLGRAEARKALRVADEEVPVVVVIGSGRAEEVAEMRTLARRLHTDLEGRAAVRLASLPALEGKDGDPPTVGLWPILAAFRGVDVVVGSGGYHCVYECRATATPLVAFARPRLYDRQAQRLTPLERVAGPREAIERIRGWLDQRGTVPRSDRADYPNGVHAAARLIEQAGDAR